MIILALLFIFYIHFLLPTYFLFYQFMLQLFRAIQEVLGGLWCFRGARLAQASTSMVSQDWKILFYTHPKCGGHGLQLSQDWKVDCFEKAAEQEGQTSEGWKSKGEVKGGNPPLSFLQQPKSRDE